jgi:hypothetical protein
MFYIIKAFVGLGIWLLLKKPLTGSPDFEPGAGRYAGKKKPARKGRFRFDIDRAGTIPRPLVILALPCRLTAGNQGVNFITVPVETALAGFFLNPGLLE